MSKFERTKPLISIIIPSWFTQSQHGKYGMHETFWFASECMSRLLSVTPREKYELIIIDNGSTITENDVEESELCQNIMGVNEYWAQADVLIRNKNNLGFAPSCNQGFDLARGEYVCCLNNDILVLEGWEEAMIETLNKQLDVKPGIAMPALLKETNNAVEAIKLKKEDVNLAKNANMFGPGAEFGSLWFCRKQLLDELKEKDGYVFDENFKLGMGEDRDLWDRVRVLGYETYRTHNTRVFHQGNMSIGKVKDRKSYTSKNREYLEEKRKKREGEK